MRTIHDTLEPIEPSAARELFLKHKATDVGENTVQSYAYRTDHFVRWCDENDIDNMNDLSGRDLQEYRLWRQEEGDLKKITLHQQMSTIRVFLKWCGSIEAVPADLYEKVMVPRVRPEQERNDETLEAEKAEAILDHLAKFHYASREHAVFMLLWETGIRIGAANALDISDVDVEEKQINLVHRPNQGTRLKNGRGGERPIAISTELAEMLEDYIDYTRPEKTDEYDREPLLSTSQGRMARATMRRLIYRTTAPCFRGSPVLTVLRGAQGSVASL
ncbi:tyrosine-type recombinase/integrase [Halovenus salina]|uniref:Tyrosine-type recombinase/integrase n=1 Tax=Halovenus salina TaxID=1510225 RepID=A0ABD5W662_9EURY